MDGIKINVNPKANDKLFLPVKGMKLGFDVSADFVSRRCFAEDIGNDESVIVKELAFCAGMAEDLCPV